VQQKPKVPLPVLIAFPVALAIFGGMVLMVAGAAMGGGSGGHTHDSAAPPSQIKPHVYDPPKDIADFTLTDQDGRPFRLSDANGKVRLIYIGYTHCPDICPTTLINFKDVRKQLGAQAGQVAFVMVTADPDADTPPVMKEFVRAFDPTFIGLSGSKSELETVWVEFGAQVQREADPGSPAGYSVTHPSSVYVLGKDGRLAMKIPYGRTPADMADDVRGLLQ